MAQDMGATGAGMPHPPRRETVVGVRVASVVAGLGLVLFFNLVGPLQVRGPANEEGKREMIIDISRIVVDWTYGEDAEGEVTSKKNPLAVQTLLWVGFFLGLGELWIRRLHLRAESWPLRVGLLPEDEKTMLTSEKLAPIYVRARNTAAWAVLPTLVRRLVREFRKSQSVERVNGLLDSSLELYLHRLDLRYAFLRYLVWLIPTLGFVGTVIGIADALAFAGSGMLPPEQLLLPTTLKLGVAFYTTLLALLMSGFLMLGLNLVQAAEEETINEVGQYCLENLVVRLTEPEHLEGAAGDRGGAGGR
jgi:biopolymer transport protein ExbB/TolQ